MFLLLYQKALDNVIKESILQAQFDLYNRRRVPRIYATVWVGPPKCKEKTVAAATGTRKRMAFQCHVVPRSVSGSKVD